MRPGIEVRPIRPEDMDGLVAVCLTARRETWTGSQLCSSDATTVTPVSYTHLTLPTNREV